MCHRSAFEFALCQPDGGKEESLSRRNKVSISGSWFQIDLCDALRAAEGNRSRGGGVEVTHVMKKRQSTAALQNVAVIASKQFAPASWSAAALRRFRSYHAIVGRPSNLSHRLNWQTGEGYGEADGEGAAGGVGEAGGCFCNVSSKS